MGIVTVGETKVFIAFDVALPCVQGSTDVTHQLDHCCREATAVRLFVA